MTRRSLVLPDRGAAIVSTDVHGNLADFVAVGRAFAASGPDAHWVILGDVVHGPDEEARAEKPELYGYPDESIRIVEELAALQRACPGRVHFVLGNHDHGHIGGPRTHKFYRDEVAHLEATLSENQRQTLRDVFSRALLAVVAPCGIFMSHGSPPDDLERLSDLDRIDDLGDIRDLYLARVVRGILTHYGQRDDVSARFLAQMSQSGVPVRVVVHGHDRDERGFFVEGERQLCLCIFGAPRENKRYLRLDLAGRYARAADLRDGIEILRVYPD